MIGKLINEDQVGYLKGRNISSVIRTIDDVIGYLNMTNKTKEFMLETLDVFWFGD